MLDTAPGQGTRLEICVPQEEEHDTRSDSSERRIGGCLKTWRRSINCLKQLTAISRRSCMVRIHGTLYRAVSSIVLLCCFVLSACSISNQPAPDHIARVLPKGPQGPQGTFQPYAGPINHPVATT